MPSKINPINSLPTVVTTTEGNEEVPDDEQSPGLNGPTAALARGYPRWRTGHERTGQALLRSSDDRGGSGWLHARHARPVWQRRHSGSHGQHRGHQSRSTHQRSATEADQRGAVDRGSARTGLRGGDRSLRRSSLSRPATGLGHGSVCHCRAPRGRHTGNAGTSSASPARHQRPHRHGSGRDQHCRRHGAGYLLHHLQLHPAVVDRPRHLFFT